ncbi:hypothetical protein EYF80_017050 [Liparis tanakae]|uniref:Uncharacterized protein n=1 Tax=Liparis tanakae TaxID=230148 RepID=A0A4Z2I3W0_9TELE|nr:hypothetical protein EYF80_017050 [Liparis tanakae]
MAGRSGGFGELCSDKWFRRQRRPGHEEHSISSVTKELASPTRNISRHEPRPAGCTDPSGDGPNTSGVKGIMVIISLWTTFSPNNTATCNKELGLSPQLSLPLLGFHQQSLNHGSIVAPPID